MTQVSNGMNSMPNGINNIANTKNKSVAEVKDVVTKLDEISNNNKLLGQQVWLLSYNNNQLQQQITEMENAREAGVKGLNDLINTRVQQIDALQHKIADYKNENTRSLLED